MNPVDCKIRAGYLRGAFPHHTPLIPGWDVAGEVATTGPAITDFLPGDRVFGYARKDHIDIVRLETALHRYSRTLKKESALAA